MGPLPVAEQVMSRFHPTLRPDVPIKDAVAVFLEHCVTGVAVVDEDGALVGFLSERDCLRAYAAGLRFDTMVGTVSDYMSTHLKTIQPTADLTTITEMFMQLPYNHLPVTEGGTLVGMVGRRDVMAAIHRIWEG